MFVHLWKSAAGAAVLPVSGDGDGVGSVAVYGKSFHTISIYYRPPKYNSLDKHPV